MADEWYLAALERLSGLIAEAWRQNISEANAAALATSDRSARPSVRMVNILGVEEEGLFFLANVNSGKIRQISANSRASMCFYWRMLEEQVIIEGSVEQAQGAVSDHYWNKMPREKQVYNSIDKKDLILNRKGELAEKIADQWPTFGFSGVERPHDWHAFYLQPDRIEFWRAGWRRAQEHVRYSKTNDGDWCKEFLGI